MLPILCNSSHGQVVLAKVHGCGWLQDGNCVAGHPWSHLAGYCPDDTAGRRDGGKSDGGLVVQG